MALNTSRNKRKHTEIEEDEKDMPFSDEEGTVVDGIFIPAPIKPVTCHISKTRLVITKITNNFFKSYADSVILGPFSKCFNAIVGPNGSGKSNVIDSMLFVFGYRAAKIRSKKLSVLLHNSEMFPNIQSCTVAVHFCEIIDKEGDNYDVVPGSEFVVSRTANKDNSSFYELNGKKVHFKLVGKLLKQHGIDLDHNRFLILQGEVEEIAMMKPKGASENETGMLEYLEDIIGTGRYKKPITQLKASVESLAEKRIEKLNRLNLISKELEQLKGPMEDAVEFLNMENRAAHFKNFQYQKAILDEEDRVKDIEADVESAKGKLREIKDRLKNITKEKSEKEEELNEETLKFQKLEKNKEKLKEAYDAADKKDIQLQAEMTQSNTNRKKMKQQLEEERKKLAKLESVPEESRTAIEECEKKERELTKKKEKMEIDKTQLLTKIAEDTKDLCAEKEKWELQLNQKKKVVASAKAAYDLVESELKIAKSQEENEKTKSGKLQETLKNCIEALQERTQQVEELGKKIPLTEKSLNDATRELQAIRTEEAQLNQEIRRNRMSLEEARASMNKSSGRGKVLEALMQQKREGKCPGLYGRLGDLGGIDAKYDVAISTACGPLDNMVVDTADTAKWCIEFLKKHGLSKSTFIALDRQEHLRQLANKKISTPENVHRLFDLIQIQDETVRTAFYYGLRDTLVANDLDQATKIAYGATRYRVVTLIGEIIETSGTMSGGGRSMMRGRMGRHVVATNVNSKDLEKMDVNLKKSEERLRVLGQKQANLDTQINALQPELSKMRLNMQKFSKELQSLKIQTPNLRKQLQVQENIAKSTKSDGQQIAKLTKSLEDRKNLFDKASEAAQEIQVEVNLLSEKIRDKTEGKTKALNKNLKEVSKSLEMMTAEITRLNVAITASARDVKKSNQKIETISQNITDTENRLREMNNEREQIEIKAQELLKNIEEIGKQLEDGNADYHKLKKYVAKLTTEEQKLLPEKCDIELNYKTATEKFNEVNAIIHQWRAKLLQLKLHKDIPEVNDESLKTLTPEEIRAESAQKIELELHTLQNKIKNSTPNLQVIEEFRKGQLTYIERNRELEEVTNKRSEMNDLRIKVENQRKDEFMVGYNVIRSKLKQMYQMITLGGDADFEIADQIDPFLEGIQFNVRPPKKSWKTISNLSGGEKTLSSLALVFALHYYKPSPLYVMDEIDAALDFKNVSIVGNYIKDRTQNAQFIIISLRPNMFELCDNLVGIYKIFNCTQTLTIDPRAFDKPVVEPVSNNTQNMEKRKQENRTSSPKNDSQGTLITISSETISNSETENDAGNQVTVFSNNAELSDVPMEIG